MRKNNLNPLFDLEKFLELKEKNYILFLEKINPFLKDEPRYKNLSRKQINYSLHLSNINLGKKRVDSSSNELNKLKNRGKNNPMYGKSLTEKHKSKIGVAVTGIKNGMFGKTHSDEVKEKLRKPKTEEHRKNLSKSMQGKKWDKGRKEKLSRTMTGSQNPNFGKQERLTCFKCGFIGGKAGITRWHNYNCKII